MKRDSLFLTYIFPPCDFSLQFPHICGVVSKLRIFTHTVMELSFVLHFSDDYVDVYRCLVLLVIDQFVTYPDSKIYGAKMGPTWGRQVPGGPYIGHVNFAIWVVIILQI